MQTKKTKVEGTCYIWALPKSEWELKQDLKEADGDQSQVMPFKYRINTSETMYTEGAVRVAEFDVIGTVPEGIDLVKKAVETLRDEIVRVRKERDKEIAELEEKIKQLALITYQPEESV